MAMAGKIQPEPPTQAEIAAICAVIQATWTPEVRAWRAKGYIRERRMTDESEAVTAPVYSERELGLQVGWDR